MPNKQSKPLPPGCQDFSKIVLEEKENGSLGKDFYINNFFREKMRGLRALLTQFDTQHEGWYWGGGQEEHSGSSQMHVWFIDFRPADKIWLDEDTTANQAAHIVIAFWKVAPSYLMTGVDLQEKELDVPCSVMAEFLKANPDLKIVADWEGWKITYRIFKKK